MGWKIYAITGVMAVGAGVAGGHATVAGMRTDFAPKETYSRSNGDLRPIEDTQAFAPTRCPDAYGYDRCSAPMPADMPAEDWQTSRF